jgi:Uma2 family endonuclease
MSQVLTAPKARAAKAQMSVEDYLAAERTSEIKHEFQHGVRLAMPNVSRAHSLIVETLSRKIGTALDGKPYEVHRESVRLEIVLFKAFVYPDVFICKPESFIDDYTATDAVVVIEILSPSIEQRDEMKNGACIKA